MSFRLNDNVLELIKKVLCVSKFRIFFCLHRGFYTVSQTDVPGQNQIFRKVPFQSGSVQKRSVVEVNKCNTTELKYRRKLKLIQLVNIPGPDNFHRIKHQGQLQFPLKLQDLFRLFLQLSN